MKAAYPRLRYKRREVYLHRLRMEQWLGRPLETKEHVHHRGSKTDPNPLINQVLLNSEHARLHARESRFWEQSYNYLVREQRRLETRPLPFPAQIRDLFG